MEEPFRRNRENFSGKQITAGTFGFALICASTGGYIYANNGLEYRYPNWIQVKNNIAAFDFKNATGLPLVYPTNCQISSDPEASAERCAFGDITSEKLALVLGDSHASAWYPAFMAAFYNTHYRGILASLPGCPPVFGIASFDGAKNICAAGFDENIGKLIATKKFDKVFLVAFWHLYSEGEPGNHPDHFISNANIRSRDAISSKIALHQALRNTINRFKEHNIETIIVRSVPTLPKRIQDLPDDYVLPIAVYQAQQQSMLDYFREQQTEQGFKIIDTTGVFCMNGSCATRIQGNVLYDDNNHITQAGASNLFGLIEDALQ